MRKETSFVTLFEQVKSDMRKFTDKKHKYALYYKLVIDLCFVMWHWIYHVIEIEIEKVNKIER